MSVAPLPLALEDDPQKTIVAITFLSAGDLSKQLYDEDLGVPDTTMLCYVELQGTFAFAGPKTEKGPMIVTYTRGFEVFDARTGNLLVAGGLDHHTASRKSLFKPHKKKTFKGAEMSFSLYKDT